MRHERLRAGSHVGPMGHAKVQAATLLAMHLRTSDWETGNMAGVVK